MRRASALAVALLPLACGRSAEVTSPGYTGPSIAGRWCAAIGAAPNYVAITFTQTDSTIAGSAADDVGATGGVVHTSTITGKYGSGFDPIAVTLSNYAGRGANTFAGAPSGSGASGAIDLRSRTDDTDLYLVADPRGSLAPCAGRYP